MSANLPGESPGCPSWCNNKHSDRPAGNLHSNYTRVGGVMVGAFQVPGLRPGLSFDGLNVALKDAQMLAMAIEHLGHPDVAAVIMEKAALAGMEAGQ